MSLSTCGAFSRASFSASSQLSELMECLDCIDFHSSLKGASCALACGVLATWPSLPLKGHPISRRSAGLCPTASPPSREQRWLRPFTLWSDARPCAAPQPPGVCPSLLSPAHGLLASAPLQPNALPHIAAVPVVDLGPVPWVRVPLFEERVAMKELDPKCPQASPRWGCSCTVAGVSFARNTGQSRRCSMQHCGRGTPM